MTNLKNYWKVLAVSAIAITSVILLASWDFNPTGSPFFNDRAGSPADTIPKKENRERKIRDLDDVLDEFNNAEMKVNMEKIQKEIKEAMKSIDKEKIKMEVDKAMKEIDMQKIQKEVQESIAKIDWDNIKKEVDESVAKIDWDKMKSELDRVKEIDMKKLDVDMKKMEEELKKIGPEVEKSMEKAKVEIEKAKVEMKEYNDFVDGLENDGLLKRKDGYTIKHKDGELIVNDKKVSNEVYNKYRSFLEKHKKFTIEKSDDDFDVDID